MTRRNFFIVCWVLAAMLAVSATADAATLTVTNGNDSGAGSIRQMIAAAQAGDTLVFAAGVTTVTLTTGQLVIDKNLTIDGGTGVTVQRSSAEGMPEFRIFYIDGGYVVLIKHTVITGGHTPDSIPGENIPDGGGLYIKGEVTLENTGVSKNTTGNGSSGFAPYSPDGKGGDGGNGGGMYVDGKATLENSTVNSNKTGDGGSGSGGGYFSKKGGDGGKGGGICVAENASLTLKNNSIVSNNTTGKGGWANDSVSGSGWKGGGIFNIGTLLIKDSTIKENRTGDGTGSGNMDLYIPGGYGGEGGGIFSGTSMTIENSTIKFNTAGRGGYCGNGGDGGGIYVDGGWNSLKSSTVNNNAAGSSDVGDPPGRGGHGGGIFINNGGLVLEYSTISGNITGDGNYSYYLVSAEKVFFLVFPYHYMLSSEVRL